MSAFRALDDQHQLVIAHYRANGRDQGKAWAAAGFATKGAKQSASRWFQSPEAQAAIAELDGKVLGRLEVTADRVLQELALLAFAPLGDKHVSTSEKRAALVDLGKHLNLFKVSRLADFLPDETDDTTDNAPDRDVARQVLLAFALKMMGSGGKNGAVPPTTKH